MVPYMVGYMLPYVTPSTTMESTTVEGRLVFEYPWAYQTPVFQNTVLQNTFMHFVRSGEIYGAIYSRIYGPICDTIHHYGIRNSGGPPKAAPTVVEAAEDRFP